MLGEFGAARLVVRARLLGGAPTKPSGALGRLIRDAGGPQWLAGASSSSGGVGIPQAVDAEHSVLKVREEAQASQSCAPCDVSGCPVDGDPAALARANTQVLEETPFIGESRLCASAICSIVLRF